MEYKELKLDTLSMKTLRAFASAFEALSDEEELGFDVVMLGLFPEAYRRMQKYASDCYTQGYIAGRAEKEGKNNEN